MHIHSFQVSFLFFSSGVGHQGHRSGPPQNKHQARPWGNKGAFNSQLGQALQIRPPLFFFFPFKTKIPFSFHFPFSFLNNFFLKFILGFLALAFFQFKALLGAFQGHFGPTGQARQRVSPNSTFRQLGFPFNFTFLLGGNSLRFLSPTIGFHNFFHLGGPQVFPGPFVFRGLRPFFLPLGSTRPFSPSQLGPGFGFKKNPERITFY